MAKFWWPWMNTEDHVYKALRGGMLEVEKQKYLQSSG